MWWLAPLVLSVEVERVVTGEVLHQLVKARVGATPGIELYAELLFASNNPIKAVKEHESAFNLNNSDLLYIGKKFGKVATSEGGEATVSGRALQTLSPIFGMCDGELILGELPRHCRRGDSGQLACNLLDGGCTGVSFDRVQHRGQCGPASIGELTVHLPCDRLPGSPLLATVPGDNRVSLDQMRAQWEYDTATGILQVWEPADPVDMWDGIVTMAMLTIFLTVWQSWTGSVTMAVLAKDCSLRDKLWENLVWYAMFISDAMCFAIASKAYSLVVESRVFLPESAGELLGDFATTYNYAFVGLSGLVALVVSSVLWLMHADHAGTAKLKQAATRICSPPVRMATLLSLRWAVDVVLLAALHVSCPEHLGKRMRAAIGLAVGIVMSVVSGRDAILLLHQRLNRPARIAVAVFALLVINHVAVFMLLDTFSTAETAFGDLPLLLAYIVSVQAAGGGAVWAFAREELLGSALGPGGRTPQATAHLL